METHINGDSDEDDKNPTENIRGRAGSCNHLDSLDDFSSINMDTVLSFPREVMNWWYMEELRDEMNCAVEFGFVDDH